MFREMQDMAPILYERMCMHPQDVFNFCMGKIIPDFDIEAMCEFWKISGKWISNMYHKVIRNRTGIG